MSKSKSEEVEKTLRQAYVHDQWESAYRTAANEKFDEEAFDYIGRILSAPKNSEILDAGCGIGANSIRLAKHGFTVMAVDFSEDILKKAELNVKSNGMEEKIKLQHENILSLTFQDETFDYVLCWGVLMHIPDLKKALAELARVLKRGGTLIVSEGNMFSLHSVIMRNIVRARRLFPKHVKYDIIKTPAGLEYWSLTPAGRLLTRQANLRWLIREFMTDGFSLKKRVAQQLTGLYTEFSSQSLKNIIHNLNNIWFKYVRMPYPAFGNIMIFQKERARL